MIHDRVQFVWQDPAAPRQFRTGVCLHGHTLHSKECLSFLPRYLGQAPGVRRLFRWRERCVDFSRAYWTPPLTAAAAFDLEREQIASMGLVPIVSLTDHDDIEAGLSLQVTRRRSEAPVSIEWTVPYENSIIHLGIHNLPPQLDGAWTSFMASYTAAPSEAFLYEILDALASLPEVLIVLNHPFWLEDGVEESAHRRALGLILARCGQWLHAFEMNGTRPWRENRDTIALAALHRRPVISGGDRHACAPSACLNLTNAATFAAFAAEVRDGRSEVLFLPQYREPMASRILADAWDILRPYPEYPDRRLWTDRVYYTGRDGQDRSLSSIWPGYLPWEARAATAIVEFVATTHLRSALRLVMADNAPIAL